MFLILWSMQAVFFIQKKIRKNAEKWVSKKSILFSLVDYVQNRKEPGRRIFLLIIRLVWPVPAWSGTLGSDLQSAFGQSGATPDASFAANWLLKVFRFGK